MRSQGRDGQGPESGSGQGRGRGLSLGQCRDGFWLGGLSRRSLQGRLGLGSVPWVRTGTGPRPIRESGQGLGQDVSLGQGSKEALATGQGLSRGQGGAGAVACLGGQGRDSS